MRWSILLQAAGAIVVVVMVGLDALWRAYSRSIVALLLQLGDGDDGSIVTFVSRKGGAGFGQAHFSAVHVCLLVFFLWWGISAA